MLDAHCLSAVADLLVIVVAMASFCVSGACIILFLCFQLSVAVQSVAWREIRLCFKWDIKPSQLNYIQSFCDHISGLTVVSQRFPVKKPLEIARVVFLQAMCL